MKDIWHSSFSPRFWRGVLPALIFLLCAGAVFPHRAEWAKVTSLTLTETGLRARIDYAITDPQFALDLRERFDGNADHVLSAEEQERLKRYLVDEALRPLRVSLDETAVAFEITSVNVTGLGDRLPSSYPITLGIHLRAKLKIDGQFHTIRISDFDARVQTESVGVVAFPKGFRLRVESRPEVVVSGDTVWRVFTGEGQEWVIAFQR